MRPGADPPSPEAPTRTHGAAADALPAEPRANERFEANPARYEIAGEHARGGLGRILAARDLDLGRPVAIKELLAATPESEARFVREALLTARLQHPAIVPIYAAGQRPDGSPFYAMKLVAGRSLKELIAAARTLDERLTLLPHVATVSDAVAYAHSQRIVHRDLKPSNVVVGEFGETVVIDWGVAKDLTAPDEPATESPAAPAAPGATVTGSVLGTPQYMPPEQAHGHAVDERADVYALGALLYHVLTGRPPYEGAWDKALAAVLAGPPAPIRTVEPGTPPDLAAIIEKAMARAPAERYASARELAEDLRRFQTGKLVSSHHYTLGMLARRWLRRYRLPVGLSALFLAVLAVVGLTSYVRSERARKAEVERKNRLTLAQARSALEKDPTAAIAWLKSYPIGIGDFRAAGNIFEAVRGGAAYAVFPSSAALWVAPDGDQAHVLGQDGRLAALDLASGRVTVEATVASKESIHCAAFSDDAARLGVVGAHELTVFDLATHAKHALALPDNARPGTAGTCEFVRRGHVLVIPTTDGLALLDADALTTRWIQGGGEAALWDLSPDRTALAWLSVGGVVVHYLKLASPDGKTLVLPAGNIPTWLGFAPDGRLVVGSRSEIIIWSPEAELERRIATEDGVVVTMGAISGDGARLVMVTSAGRVSIVTLGDGSVQMVGELGRVPGACWIAFADDERAIVVGATGGVVRWDLASGEVQSVEVHDDMSGGVSRDGRVVGLLGLISHEARVFRLPGSTARMLPGTWKKATRAVVAFSPDGRRLAYSSSGTIRVCDQNGEGCQSFAGDAWQLEFAGDSRRLAVSGPTGGWIDLRDGTAHLEARPERAGFGFDTAWAPDSRLLAIVDQKHVRVVDAEDGAMKLDVNVAATTANKPIWAPAGHRLAWREQLDQIVALDLERGVRRELSADFFITFGLFSPDGHTLVAGTGDGKLWVWDVDTAAMRILRGHTRQITRLALSPDGHSLASASADGSARIWDLTTGESHVLDGHTDVVWSAEFSPDGNVLATASTDRTARIWDIASGDARVLRGHMGSVRSAKFSPDGLRLATAGMDDRVILWNLDRLPLPLVDAAAVEAAVRAESTVVLGADDRPVTLIPATQ